MRVPVTILESITAPFGTYYETTDGDVFWKYCREIDGRWYFETQQKLEAEQSIK